MIQPGGSMHHLGFVLMKDGNKYLIWIFGQIKSKPIQNHNFGIFWLIGFSIEKWITHYKLFVTDSKLSKPL